MYARLLLFNLGPGMQSTVEKAVEGSASVYKPLKGFKSATFLSDDAVGEYGAFSLWESKEDADAAAVTLKARVQEAVGSIIKEPLTFRLFEVLHEAKA